MIYQDLETMIKHQDLEMEKLSLYKVDQTSSITRTPAQALMTIIKLIQLSQMLPPKDLQAEKELLS
jgi:hypothetical protein